MSPPKSEPERRNLRAKRVVDALVIKPQAYRVYDTTLPGFALRVSPRGTRSFSVDYRHRGVKRRMYLGDTRTLAPDEAYKLALAALAAAKMGRDPLNERRDSAVEAKAKARSRRAAPTLAIIADQYLKSLELTGSAKWSYEARRLYLAHIEPALGKKKVEDVTISDVRSLHERLHKTAPTANRVRAVLSAILSRARDDGALPSDAPNPCDRVKPYDEEARSRYLSNDEWERLGNAIKAERKHLSGVPDHDTRPSQLDAIVLLCLTGARLNAITVRRWDDVDWENRVLRVEPAHKGATKIYLGDSAFAHVQAWSASRGGRHPYMFPGQHRKMGLRTARGERDKRPIRGAAPIGWVRAVWDSLVERAELVDVTPHDLRRSFATTAGDVGISTHLISGLLSHVVPGVTGIYAHRTDPALIGAANQTSAEILRRLGLSAPSDPKVLAIGGARAHRAR